MVSYFGLTQENTKLIFDEIKQVAFQANTHIQGFVKNLATKSTEAYNGLIKAIADKQNEASYKEGKHVFDENTNLVNFTNQINLLSQKKNLISKEQEILNTLYQERKDVANDMLNEHLSYLDLMNSIASELRIKHDNIMLSADYLLSSHLEESLNEALSLRSGIMTELIEKTVSKYNNRTKQDVRECLVELLNKAFIDELNFKNGYNAQMFISKILSTNWFELKFNVEYEDDNLSDMSPGKRSFVVLKLLLDFSDKKCPILIDQPEDNLDNRAIYNELVKYIREKKKERQIILVTHNPNIVVGADSEEVIVANQNGKNAPNDGGIKFQYVFGSLENSVKRNDNDTMPILYRCGIREHVCDILEGGENAFRDRECKYGFFKI